jgi:hypothetical protein
VAQPLLYLAGGRTVLMAIRGEVLAESVKYPMLTYMGVGTRDGLAVLDALALAAVQPPP